MGIQPRNDGLRYEAVLRLSEALSVCTEPEDLTKILSERLREFLDFLQFYIVVYKEESSEVEWAVVGREKSLMAAYADVPVEQRPSWQAYTTQEPFHIRDWNADERIPARLKQGIAAQGLDVGPLVFVPLTTPHRRLGALGMSGAPGTVYSTDDVSFLRLIGRVVALAIDDNFNLRRADVAQRELQRQNERLQRSEHELRAVIETIPSMAWSAAADGAAEFFNGRWLAYAGLTADQAHGWGWTVAIHPDDLSALVDYWRTVLASGQSGEIEARLRRFDGVYRWFLFRATPSLDSDGRVVKWYGTNTDIEERKLAEDAVKRSETYLAEAQKLSRTGSFGWDVSSGEIYWSRETFRIFEYEPTAQVSLDQIVQRTHPEDRLAVQQLIERVSRERKEWDFEHRLLMPDGSVKYLRVVGHPSHGESGKFEFVGAVTDITERKRAEEELRRSEENHRIVVETASDVVISMDETGLILLANPASKRVFGYDSAELMGKPMTTLMPEFMRKLHETGLRRYLASGQRHMNWQGTELIGLRKNGEEFPVEVSFGEQIRNGHRVFTGFLRDISEKKRAEEALRASELSLRLMVDSIPGLVNTTNAAGEIELANQQLLNYVGMTLEELKNWRPLVHPDDRALVETLWSDSVERGHPYEDEHRLRRADGVYRWFHARGLPLRDKEGRIVRWYVLLTDIDERKKAEEQLRRSEAYLSEAQRLAHTGNWVWQVAGRDPLYLSEEWYRIYGFEIAEGMPGWEKRLQRVYPADRSSWQEVIERAIREKSECDMEYRILLPDGTVKWIHAVAHPVLNASGDLVQFMGTSMDITERKHAEESLRRSESYLAQAQRLAHIGSWAWEIPSRKALYISEEWFRIYGFDPKDGLPSWEQRLQRVHPEDRAGFQAGIDRAIAEKSDYDVEFRMLPPHSPERYIHSVGHPVLGPSGEVLQFVGVSMDITESKQAEEAFRLIVVATAATTGRDFFQSLVQYMAQALHARYAFVTTCDDQKHARTLAFWKGDGFGENFEFDIADTPCEKVLHGELCHYRQGLRGLFPQDKILADWQAESYLGVPMLDGSNRVIGHIAILDDRPMEADLRGIDLLKIFASRAAAELKRQRAEEELHAALQERERLRRAQAELAHINRVSTMGELTASLAHEIKQPIGAAVTNAEATLRLLNRNHPDIAEARDAALEMVKDARRAAAIIDRVRSLYQKGSSQLDAVDINQVIGEMVVMLQTEARRHSVLIRTDLAGGLPAATADRVQLQQVLMNLMLNGIEAMRDTTGELSIKSQLAEDGQLLISVTDTGVGVPTQNLNRIFDAFFTTKSQGTGLGLAITRSIVESHGGRVWATPNPGRGATFYFTLPSTVAVTA